MNKIKFLRGSRENYDQEEFKGYLYFALDTREIIVDGISYGIAYEDQNLDAIIKVEPGLSNSELVFTHRDGSSSTFTLPTASQTEDGLMSKDDKIKLDDVYERLSWVDLSIVDS